MYRLENEIRHKYKDNKTGRSDGYWMRPWISQSRKCFSEVAAVRLRSEWCRERTFWAEGIASAKAISGMSLMWSQGPGDLWGRRDSGWDWRIDRTPVCKALQAKMKSLDFTRCPWKRLWGVSCLEWYVFWKITQAAVWKIRHVGEQEIQI